MTTYQTGNLDLSDEKSDLNIDPTVLTNTAEYAEPPPVVRDALKYLKLGGGRSTRSVQIEGANKNGHVFRELPLKNQILQKLRDGLPQFEV